MKCSTATPRCHYMRVTWRADPAGRYPSSRLSRTAAGGGEAGPRIRFFCLLDRHVEAAPSFAPFEGRVNTNASGDGQAVLSAGHVIYQTFTPDGVCWSLRNLHSRSVSARDLSPEDP